MVGWSRSWSICWCRSWSICWSRGISRGWSIGWSWGIFLLVNEALVGAGNSLVLDISVVLLVLVHEVVNYLGPAVRELHSVLTLNIVSIPLLSPGVDVRVSVAVIAVHIIAKLIVLGFLLMVGFRMVVGGGRMVGWLRDRVDSVVGNWMWGKGYSWAMMGGIMTSGDHNSSMADGGVMGDISKDSSKEGTHCYYLHGLI